MAINFDKFQFHNSNGIKVQVILEAPIGKKLLDLSVGPDSDANVPPFSEPDVRTLKLTVLADPDEHPADIETIDFTHADPFPVYVRSFVVRSAIGSIEGEVSLAIPRI